MWLWSFYIVKVFRKTSCMANTTFQNSLTWPSQRCCCPLWHHRANEKPFLTIPKIQNTAKFWLETQILKVLKCKILKVFDLWVSCVQDMSSGGTSYSGYKTQQQKDLRRLFLLCSVNAVFLFLLFLLILLHSENRESFSILHLAFLHSHSVLCRHLTPSNYHDVMSSYFSSSIDVNQPLCSQVTQLATLQFQIEMVGGWWWQNRM